MEINIIGFESAYSVAKNNTGNFKISCALFVEVADSLIAVVKDRDELLQRIEAMDNQEPVHSQFYCDSTKTWCNFLNDDHKKNTIEAGYLVRDLYAMPVQSSHDQLAATKLNDHYLKLVQAQQEEIDMLAERLKFWESRGRARGRACESNLEQLEQDFDQLENKSGMATSYLG